MFYLYSIVPAVLMIPVGIYLYFYFRRMAAFFHGDVKRRGVKAALIVVSVAVALLAVNIWGLGAVVVLYGVMFAVIMDVIDFVVCRVHGVRKRKAGAVIADGGAVDGTAVNGVRAEGTSGGRGFARWKKIYSCGLVPLLCLALAMGYGYWNMAHVVEIDYTVTTAKNIRDEGYRIALISDLHFGTTMDAEKLQERCDEIEAAQPDLIVLCGDIVDEATTKAQMQSAAGILGAMASEYGVFYVFGNHDRAWYSDRAEFTAEELESALKAEGIHVLCDDTYVINDELTVIGREDRSFFGGSGRMTQAELLEGVDTSDFLLLLDHQPSELSANAQAGFDLQLSGHTHGGQIWPVGVISDILGFGELNYGYEQIGDFQVIVSSGIAGWGYAVRTGAHSEFVVVDVVANK